MSENWRNVKTGHTVPGERMYTSVEVVVEFMDAVEDRHRFSRHYGFYDGWGNYFEWVGDRGGSYSEDEQYKVVAWRPKPAVPASLTGDAFLHKTAPGIAQRGEGDG